MEIITLTKDNLWQEHICCAISNDKDIQVSAKKYWLAQCLPDGLVFKKGDVRGKCFIEYIPAENAWAPVWADGYTYINCLWVSGQFKGHGYSNQLLQQCIDDSVSKGKKGLAILSAKKKMPFLSDPDYLFHKGFLSADTAQPYFVLMYLPFSPSAEKPRFRRQVKTLGAKEQGYVLYYTHQCPFTAKYVPIAQSIAKAYAVPFRAIRLESAAQAQNAPTPFPTYSLFCNGEFITNEILSGQKFEKMLITREY